MNTLRTLAFASFVLTACGGTDAGSGDPTGRGVVASSVDGVAVVRMTDEMRFEPAAVRVHVGDTIVWTVAGPMPHTVTDDPNRAGLPEHAVLPEGAVTWDSGLIDPGTEFRRVFDVPGTYTYLCTIHEAQGMVGTIIVE